jgi:hypothetical protein
VSSLAVGRDPIRAAYAGSAGFTPSKSAVVIETIRANGSRSDVASLETSPLLATADRVTALVERVDQEVSARTESALLAHAMTVYDTGLLDQASTKHVSDPDRHGAGTPGEVKSVSSDEQPKPRTLAQSTEKTRKARILLGDYDGHGAVADATVG